MRSSLATFALFVVSLWSVQADIENDLGSHLRLEEEIYRVVDSLHEQLSVANEMQLFGYDDTGRRLAALGEFPDISYSALCTGTCWTNLKSAFTNSMAALNSDTCKKKAKGAMATKYKSEKTEAKKEKAKMDTAKKEKDAKQGGSNENKETGKGKEDKAKDGKTRRLRAKTDYATKESDCMFDICPKIAAMCNETNATTQEERNNASRIKAVYNDMDDCAAANVNFLCNSVCSSNCSGNVDARKMLCGSSGKATGGKYSTDKSGGGLKKMFNNMCMMDGNGAYCYDKIKADVKGNKLESGKGDAGFPDPCTLDCSSTAATAVTDMGCCFSAVMDAQRKYKAMDKGQMRMLKGIAKVCGGAGTLASCTSGIVEQSKSKQMKLNLNVTCDALSSDAAEASFTQMLTDAVNGTSLNLEILTCKPKGKVCGSTTTAATTTAEATTTVPATRRLDADERRLDAVGSELEVNAEAIGADAQAQLDAISITDDVLSGAETAAVVNNQGADGSDGSDGASTASSGNVGGASTTRPMLTVFGFLAALLALAGK